LFQQTEADTALFCIHRAQGTTLAKLQDDVVAVLAGGQDWKDFLARAAMMKTRPVARLNDHAHDTSASGKVYDQCLSSSNDQVWKYVTDKITRKVTQEGTGEPISIENNPNETTERFHNAWDEEVAPGLQSMRDLKTWFAWDQDQDERQCYETVSPSFVGRKEVLIDWLFDPATDLLMVTSLHQAVEMLATEHRSIIDIHKSVVRTYSAVFSNTHESRDDVLVFDGEEGSAKPISVSCLRELTVSASDHKTREPWREVTTCFSGDHLQLEVSLRNCFNQVILIPSKKTKWEVCLVGRANSASRETEEVRVACVLLRAFSREAFGTPAKTFVEIVLPSDVEQGKYQMELKVFDNILPWDSEDPIELLDNLSEGTCFGNTSVLDGGGTPTEEMARALANAGVQQGDQLQIHCREQLESKTATAMSVVKGFPRCYEVCSLSEKSVELDRPYLPGFRNVGRELDFNFEKVLSVARVLGHGAGAPVAAIDSAPSHRAENLLFVQRPLRARKDVEFAHNAVPPSIPADSATLDYKFGTLLLGPKLPASDVEVHGAIVYAVLERCRLAMGETAGCNVITKCTGLEQWDPVGECQVRLARLARGQYSVEAMKVSADMSRYTDVTIEGNDDLELEESDHDDDDSAEGFDRKRQLAKEMKKKEEERMLAEQSLDVILSKYRNLQLWKSYDGSFEEVPLVARKSSSGSIEWYGVVDSVTIWATWDYDKSMDEGGDDDEAAPAASDITDADGSDDDADDSGTAVRRSQGCLKTLKAKLKASRKAKYLEQLEFKVNSGTKEASVRLDTAIRGELSRDGRVALLNLAERKSCSTGDTGVDDAATQLLPFWSAPIQFSGTKSSHSIVLQGRDKYGRPGQKLNIALDMDFAMGLKDDSFKLELETPPDAAPESTEEPQGFRLQASACLLGVASSDDRVGAGSKQQTNADGTRYRTRCYLVGNGESQAPVASQAKSLKCVVLGAANVAARAQENAQTDAATRQKESADDKARAEEAARKKKAQQEVEKARKAKLAKEKAEKQAKAKAEKDVKKAAEQKVKAEKKAAADKVKAEKKAAADKAAADKAAADKAAADKAAKAEPGE